MQVATEWHRGLRLYLKVGDNPRVIARAREVWGEALGLCAAQRWRTTLDRPTFENRFAPYSGASAALQALLADCERVVLLAVSIGGALEQRVRDYMAQRRPMEAYLLDRMGSFLAEAYMRQLDRALQRESASDGRRTTRRFSPGYHDFDLQAQTRFVALIGDRWPGLRLTDAGLLLPEKTITAVKGIWPARGSEGNP